MSKTLSGGGGKEGGGADGAGDKNKKNKKLDLSQLLETVKVRVCGVFISLCFCDIGIVI